MPPFPPTNNTTLHISALAPPPEVGDTSSDQPLSSGALIGIIIAVVVLFGALGFCVLHWMVGVPKMADTENGIWVTDGRGHWKQIRGRGSRRVGDRYRRPPRDRYRSEPGERYGSGRWPGDGNGRWVRDRQGRWIRHRHNSWIREREWNGRWFGERYGNRRWAPHPGWAGNY
ncbi:hypothetical protein K505DRAFT_341378 [Melanomma pulvis-pyrius CBS 109.77]|uniref:Uncharacterized protein n=1 Tax=Melanomma pulvis-pyrius CBS 109.77 TaxID=1314802 RepID=A0A6A6WZC1_9PLEO|nr:hypothetical protein K505DRAFT_341378 [Melanomma pulvis-pyrius CBS 109.77]